MINWPKEMSGTSTFVQAYNRLLRAARQCEIIPSPTVLPKKSMKGTALDARSSGGSTPTTPTSTLQMSYVQQCFSSYLLLENGSRVAKPTLLWTYGLIINQTRTTYGYTLTYKYPHFAVDALYGQVRTSTYLTNPAQKECIQPQYLLGDQIYYQACGPIAVFSEPNDPGNPLVTTVSFIDLNIDGRDWMQFYDQTFVI